MTRRIGAALVGVVALVLVAVVIPLGLLTTRHERADFTQASLRQAMATAQLAEEHLADHGPGAPLVADLRRVRGAGEAITVLGRNGTRVASVGARLQPTVLARANRVTRPTTISGAGEAMLVVAVPVSDGGDWSGVVVQARPTTPLTEHTHQLWATLVAVGVLAVAVAGAVSVWLSSWVTRPIRRLEAAVGRIGAGDLDARAGDLSGPPETAQLASAFDAMAGRLQALIVDHRSMIADVSHQLRTPITALRLRLELLTDQQQTPDPVEIAGVLDEVSRLGRMVDGLLAVARAEATDTAPVGVDLTEVIADRVAAWAPLAAEQHVGLTAGTGPPVRVLATPGHLEQVLDNLIANSLGTQPAPRQVGLTAGVDGRMGVVVVRDDGPGMTPEQSAHAFDRFRTDRETGGSGLGLTIVRSLVTAAGGAVALAPTPGGGLTVTVTLPLDPGAPAPRRGHTGGRSRE